MPTKIPPPSLPDKGKTITFHRFPHHIWHDQNLSLHERVVLCRVWSFLPRRCYLSYAQWAKELGCHRVTAVEILNKLVGKNKLTKSPAPEGSNEWHLVVSDYHLINEDDVASSPTLLPLVVTDYPPSSPTLPVLVVTDYPRRSLEDQLKDHKEDQLVADAPTPPCEYSLILGEPQDFEGPLESDSLKEPIEISEAPPIPAAPPKKRKEPSGRKVTFPSPEYWASVKPDLLSWMRDHGAQGTDEELLRWIDERLEKLEGTALSKDMKYAAWDRTFMTWYRHLIPDKYKRGFDWFVRNAVDQTKFVEVWKKKRELEAFGYSDEGIEGYRKTLLNFDEDSPWGGNKIKHFRKTVQKGA